MILLKSTYNRNVSIFTHSQISLEDYILITMRMYRIYYYFFQLFRGFFFFVKIQFKVCIYTFDNIQNIIFKF